MKINSDINPPITVSYGFFIPFFIFMILGGIGLINMEKGELILFFSEHRSVFWNYFFRYFTLLGEAGVYLVGVLVFLFIQYRRAICFPILGILVSVVSYFSKIYFSHPRPALFFTRLGVLDAIPLVPNVLLNGGNSSFPSGHTMSAFAIYTFISLSSSRVSIQFLFFVIALLVGFSRIYLVQHFFEDVYVGAIIGTFLGWVVFQVQARFSQGMGRLRL